MPIFSNSGYRSSDPLADGPVIQRADVRSLKAGTNLSARVFEIVKEVRKGSDIPLRSSSSRIIILFTIAGISNFYREPASAGADGILIADMPVEESDDAVSAARDAGIDQNLHGQRDDI